MSVVTNVILTTAINDGAGVEALNAHVAKDEGCSGGTLVKVNEHAGGTKCIEADVYMAAFNYLDVEPFVEAARAFPWRWPESVSLFIQQQNDDTFTERLRVTGHGR